MLSLNNIDKDCIFLQTGNNISDLANNPYMKSTNANVTASGGNLVFNGTNAKITYSGTKKINTICIKIASLASTSQHVLTLSASHNITITSGTIAANGFSSPSIYVNGLLSSTITTAGGEIVITTATQITANTIILGYVSSYLSGSITLLEFYNVAKTAYEVYNMYTNKTFKEVPAIDVATTYTSAHTTLLDFDSRQGILIDKTGQRTLTLTSITLKKYAYFDGSTSKIDTDSDCIGTGNRTVSVWSKLNTFGKSAFGTWLSNDKFTFRTNNGTISVYSDFSTQAVVAVGTLKLNIFQNIIITRTSSGIANFYVNGVSVGTLNQSSGTPIAGVTNVIIGNNNAQIRTMNGVIPRLKVFSGILTPYEIAQLFTSERGQYGI